MYLRIVDVPGPKTIEIVIQAPETSDELQAQAQRALDQSDRVRAMRAQGYTVRVTVRPLMANSTG